MSVDDVPGVDVLQRAEGELDDVIADGDWVAHADARGPSQRA